MDLGITLTLLQHLALPVSIAGHLCTVWQRYLFEKRLSYSFSQSIQELKQSNRELDWQCVESQCRAVLAHTSTCGHAGNRHTCACEIHPAHCFPLSSTPAHVAWQQSRGVLSQRKRRSCVRQSQRKGFFAIFLFSLRASQPRLHASRGDNSLACIVSSYVTAVHAPASLYSLTSDVLCFVRREEGHQPRHVLRLPKPPLHNRTNKHESIAILN